MEPTPAPPTSEFPAAPPPAPALVGDQLHRLARPGDLTPGWSTVFWLSWAGVTAGLAAVWYSSRITGLATWWLGPEVSPHLIFVNLAPFVAPLALCVLALSHRRWLPYWGIAGAIATALVAVFDLDHVRGYAVVEFILAAGGMAVSVASFGGLLRRDTTAAG